MDSLGWDVILTKKMAGMVNHATDEANVETINFEADASFLRATQAMLRDILWQAPSDAVAKVKFKRVPRGYIGILYVSGLQKKFISTVRSRGLTDLPEVLGRKMAERIMAWKKLRVFS